MSQTTDAFKAAQNIAEWDWLYEDAARTIAYGRGKPAPDRFDYRHLDELLADCGIFDQRRRTHDDGGMA